MASDPTKVTPPPEVEMGAIGRGADRIVTFIARHWLALFTTAWGVYVFTPFLAAVFMQIGWVGPASVIYTIYSFLCHQLPDHSYFLFGPDLVPTREALLAAGMPNTTNVFVEREFIGNSTVGWKVPLCERDIAIYGAVFLTGIAYSQIRKYTRRAISWKVFALLALPMAVDGLTQAFGWRESNWWLRTITGALFAVGAVLWAYPYVNLAMNDVLEDQKKHTERSKVQ